MKATVTKCFIGFNREFKSGETVDLSAETIEKLNKAGLGIILEVKIEDINETTERPRQVGGGYYELSNGEKVRGKDAAIAAQAEIDASGS